MTATEQPARRPAATILAAGDAVTTVAAAAAIFSLAVEYGFRAPLPVRVGALHLIQAAVLGLFIVDRALRLALVEDRRLFLRENWIDFALMLLAGVAALTVRHWLEWIPDLTEERAQKGLLILTTGYIVITQLYLLGARAARAVGWHLRAAGAASPITAIFALYAATILLGAALLLLPEATPQDDPIGVTDALFTAASATCANGLAVRDTAIQFSQFGQVVILGCMQAGGLGIMLLGAALAVVAAAAREPGAELSVGGGLSEETIRKLRRAGWFVFATTLAIEAAGAAATYPMWLADRGGNTAQGALSGAGFDAIFHAVSAVCNAGFSLRSGSLSNLRQHWEVLGVMMPLIVLGGLGFPVLLDLAKAVRSLAAAVAGKARDTAPLLSLHTKLVLTTTAVLIALGFVGLMVTERFNFSGRTFGGKLEGYGGAVNTVLWELPPGERAQAALFQSVSARTAGLSTVSVNRLSEAGKLWTCLLMLVGGSPASAAGGMRTLTLALLVLGAWSALRRREGVGAFGRRFPGELVRRAGALAAAYLAFVLLVTLLACIGMSGRRLASTGTEPTFMQMFFESCSACGSVGLSCDVTPSLSPMARWVILAAMYLGRLGPLALLMWLVRPRPADPDARPAEDVTLA